ncbi:IucA/IucC family protein [Streptomyces sp. NPDC088387]|uniref:IucA/IucC family protein n=1 Tax=Streptomyces sp. NPDC088387 TaxID=3365859 RepID=UPI0037FA8497
MTHVPSTPSPTPTHLPRTTAPPGSPPQEPDPSPRNALNSTPPRPDKHPHPDKPPPSPEAPSRETPSPSVSVPRQQRGAPRTEQLRGVTTDLLEHPDPHTAAQAAAIENLLRCWVRETNLPAPDDATLRIPLPATGTTLLAPVLYWSAMGWHRFGLPHLAAARPTTDTADAAPPAVTPPVDAVTLAALLGREKHGTAPAPSPSAGTTASLGPGDLVAHVADSVRRTSAFIAERRRTPADSPDLFLSAEQALLLGHPLHPTPKTREGLTDSEARLYSPELRGAFRLHWLAVAPSVLATDSSWTERGRRVLAAALTARLAGPDLHLPHGHAALPLHPWQLRDVLHRPDIAALRDAGLLRDLGVHGPAWCPTSSVRTVYRSDAPAMLKLSLGLRITNSRRENLRKELHRGVEVHRLLRTGLARQWQATHPTFDVVRDPAWLAVDTPDGRPVRGLDVLLRHNPFRPSDDVTCVAGLVAPRPVPTHTTRPSAPATVHGHHHTEPTADPEPGPMTSHPNRSRLSEIVTRLAGRTGRPRGAVATEWFLRYLEHVVRPVLWLDGEAGIALEAHQQNTLLLLDPDGWPAGGRYRDNQGYYFRESRRAELDTRLPGIGEHSDTFVADEVADERFAYYLAINNVLGLIGALGSQRLADEQLLLAAFRRFLEDVSSGPAGLRSTLPARLLDAPVLRCKANLLTRLHGLDELVGPVDTQSVYVTIANPLRS